MNIFVLSRNVRTCARMHSDQHVVQMPHETAQLLASALQLADPGRWELLQGQGCCVEPAPPEHPCSRWARDCINNYLWLARLGLELCEEFSFRFAPDGGPPVQHGALNVLRALRGLAPALPDKRVVTPFPLVMPLDCQLPGDPVSSYRRYYLQHEAASAHWTRRETPAWWSQV